MTTVAVLGTGTMGAGMARSLLREGHRVRAWNRTQARAEPLVDQGATVCATAAEAVRGAEVVLIMLFDADSVLAVLDRCADDIAADTVVLQCSTVGLDLARITEAVAGRPWSLIDAPVLGTKAPAEKGQLTVLAAGDPGVRERVRPVLDAIGGRTLWVGDEPGPASRLKLVCNAWVASITAATGQSVALAEQLELDPALFLDAIDGSAVDSPYAHLKGAAMISGAAQAGAEVAFEVDGVRKDLSLITAAAERAGVAVDLLDALTSLYARASAAGHGHHDIAAVRAAF